MTVTIFVLTLMFMDPSGSVKTIEKIHSSAAECAAGGAEFISDRFEVADAAGIRIAYVCEPKKVPGA